MKKIMSKKLKMAITLSVCAILLVFGTIMGTVAYLTSQATVKNTFTYGNVSITMSELTADGTDRTNTADNPNSYKLIPGGEYKKDLQIDVAANSEACYLFVKIAKAFADIDSGIEADLAANGWAPLDADAGVYYYKNTETNNVLASRATVQKIPVITSFTVDTDETAQTLETFANTQHEVIGYAVQAAGFPDVDAAWAGTFGN